MADDRSESGLLSPRSFEWDEEKRELNLAKHGIDFDSAIDVFRGRVIIHRSDRNNEDAGQLWVIRKID
jgi:uncharacterized protein